MPLLSRAACTQHAPAGTPQALIVVSACSCSQRLHVQAVRCDGAPVFEAQTQTLPLHRMHRQHVAAGAPLVHQSCMAPSDDYPPSHAMEPKALCCADLLVERLPAVVCRGAPAQQCALCSADHGASAGALQRVPPLCQQLLPRLMRCGHQLAVAQQRCAQLCRDRDGPAHGALQRGAREAAAAQQRLQCFSVND